jgi:hypothetical protein
METELIDGRYCFFHSFNANPFNSLTGAPVRLNALRRQFVVLGQYLPSAFTETHNHQLRTAIVTANWRGCEGGHDSQGASRLPD